MLRSLISSIKERVKFLKADLVHMWVAQHKGKLLKKNWEMTKRVLLKDIDTGVKETIAYALYSFIALGKKEIIPVLINKLNQEGTAEMAETYLNCGHEKLHDAAVNWTHQHGYGSRKTHLGEIPELFG